MKELTERYERQRRNDIEEAIRQKSNQFGIDKRALENQI